MKKLFKGIFNYFGQNFVLHTQTLTEERAFLNFCSQIAKRAGVGRRTVMQKFDGSRDNYLIKEIRR